MAKMRFENLQPQFEQQILQTLTYQGKIAAIKLYIEHTGCRLREARQAIDRISHGIEPGQAR